VNARVVEHAVDVGDPGVHGGESTSGGGAVATRVRGENPMVLCQHRDLRQPHAMVGAQTV
jgi:hypothetical protein